MTNERAAAIGATFLPLDRLDIVQAINNALSRGRTFGDGILPGTI